MKRQCIKCGKEIKRFKIDGQKFKTIELPVKQEMWDGGIVDEIFAGYGSKFDGQMFVITICDECISDSLDRLEKI